MRSHLTPLLGGIIAGRAPTQRSDADRDVRLRLRLTHAAGLTAAHPARRELSGCVPALATGLVRCFGVAFPNEGSQPDKAFIDEAGARPGVVLLCDLTKDTGSRVNGVCLPVGEHELARLRDRERPYHTVDVTARVTPYPGWGPLGSSVLAFLGREEFTRPDRVEGGVVSAGDLATIVAGAQHWEGLAPGFAAHFKRTTRLPELQRIRALRQVDLRGGTGS